MMIKDGFLKDTTSLEEVMDMVMEISDSFPELNNPSLTKFKFQIRAESKQPLPWNQGCQSCLKRALVFPPFLGRLLDMTINLLFLDFSRAFGLDPLSVLLSIC